jgi:hypothetical protein
MPDEVIAGLFQHSGGASAAAVFLPARVLQHKPGNRMISIPRLHHSRRSAARDAPQDGVLAPHGEERGKAARLVRPAGVAE